MSGHLAIRTARIDDADAVARLADELRTHLGDPLGHLDADAIRRDGFGEAPEFDILVAEVDGEVLGYALFYDAYEPAYAAKGLYLADFCVAPSARRSGVGRALMAALTQAAKSRGRIFVWWTCKPDNVGALAFYQALEPQVREPMISHALVFR